MAKYSDILAEIQKANVKLKVILNEVSQIRVKCVQMQLDILSMYKPKSLEIHEMLKSVNQDHCLSTETSPLEKSHTLINNKL